MSSVRYVHTHHFIQETLAFLQHFNQLQDVLGRMRAANAGQKIAEKATRGGRISMDIQAGAPIILIPHSSQTTDVLVLNMGTLTVSNTFLFSGSPGTIQFEKKEKHQKDHARRQRAETNDDAAMSRSRTDTGAMSMSMMSASIYGSLDGDLRTTEMAPMIETGLINTLNQQISSVGSDVNGQSIGDSLHSSLNESERPSSPVDPPTPPPLPSFSIGDTLETNVATTTDEGSSHICLVDVMSVELTDMEVYYAEWVSSATERQTGDLAFPSYLIQRQPGKMLKEKCKLTLQVRNIS